MKLHHDLVSAAGATPTGRVVFLHGILGSGANLRSHARRFVDARPQWQAVLVDLRAHGRSLATDGRPDTIEVAADDVLQTLGALPSVPLRAAVGHSFGGKVALQLASQVALEHVVTLDSAPGTRIDARGSEATLGVLQMLAAMRGPWESRDAFMRDVLAGGQSPALAQWLAMNLERRDEGLFFRLDLRRIDALLRSYLACDLWPVIEATHAQVHLVIGGRSSVYVAEDQTRARVLEGENQGRVTVDVLNAGHWLHVDDPDGVQRVLLQRT